MSCECIMCSLKLRNAVLRCSQDNGIHIVEWPVYTVSWKPQDVSVETKRIRISNHMCVLLIDRLLRTRLSSVRICQQAVVKRSTTCRRLQQYSGKLTMAGQKYRHHWKYAYTVLFTMWHYYRLVIIVKLDTAKHLLVRHSIFYRCANCFLH